MEAKITIDDLMAIRDGVFIAMPMGEEARFNNYWASFMNVMTPPKTIRFPMFGIYIANLENAMVREFLKTDCTWFWIANDDQIYPFETLIRLMRHGKDIVAPLCLKKNAPHEPLLYGKRNPDGTHPYMYLEKGDRGLCEVGASATGGMLIHRRVFETLKDPWFTVELLPHPETGKIEQNSEDFPFCDAAVSAGFKIWADLDLSVMHMAIYGVMAVRGEDGQWYTSLRRETEQVLIPAAEPMEGRLQSVKPKILVPDTPNWNQVLREKQG